MSDIIFLSNVRLSFPHLAEPQKQVNEATGATRISYNAEFLMPQDHPGFAQFMARYGAIALEKWKEHAQAVMQMIQNDRKTRCFGRGEEKISRKTMQPYDGYAGNIYITAGRDTAPQMIQADGTPVDPANTMAYQQLARKMYGGCRVNAAVKPWPQDNKVGRGIRCDLIAVQFAGDDTPFGEGATDASGLFGAVQQAAAMSGAVFPSAGQQTAMPAAPFAQPGLPSFLGGQ
jgi:hypothetical protein